MTALRPFFCYYGGKWRAAPRYPTPLHQTIIEPFAGAAGYSTRHAHRRVILVEKDPVIAALWEYLIRVSVAEILAIPLLGPDETTDDLGVCEEAKTLVGFWLNKGTTQPRRAPSSWARENRFSDQFWGEAIRGRIAAQVDSIRHWQIVHGSFTDFTPPSHDATWFVDPPYERQGRYYRHGSKEIDFARLGEWCKSLHGQVIVCEQAGASWLPFKPFATLKANESKNGRGTSEEVLWTNYDLTQQLSLLEAKP